MFFFFFVPNTVCVFVDTHYKKLLANYMPNCRRDRSKWIEAVSHMVFQLWWLQLGDLNNWNLNLLQCQQDRLWFNMENMCNDLCMVMERTKRSYEILYVLSFFFKCSCICNGCSLFSASPRIVYTTNFEIFQGFLGCCLLYVVCQILYARAKDLKLVNHKKFQLNNENKEVEKKQC